MQALTTTIDQGLFLGSILNTIREPLVVLGHDLCVLGASNSFYRTFGVEGADIRGRPIYELGAGEWNIPELRQLLQGVIPDQRTIEAYEVECEFPSLGKRVMLLNARQILGSGGNELALLLAIDDITERRAIEREKDDLLRQKEMLLQEMQHRVANSLQIIASILLLKARSVQSEETRLHLHEAHQRVMAMATVQQQLNAVGSGGTVEIRPYLTKLCERLGASMIGERRPLAVEVRAAAGTAISSDAVSLGLIVTELVINALKHGFPDGRSGRIVVTYDRVGTGWKLSVSDTGVGRPAGGKTRSGLGTTIVEALASQLNASVDTSSGPAGTSVSIVHQDEPNSTAAVGAP